MIHILEQQRQAQAQATPSNIVINSTFDDATNLTLESNWSVNGGTLDYNAGGVNWAHFDLSEDIINGGDYDISIEIPVIQSGKWAVFEVSTNSGTDIIKNYSNITAPETWTDSISFSGTDSSILSIRAKNYSGGGTFSLDNISIIKTN